VISRYKTPTESQTGAAGGGLVLTGCHRVVTIYRKAKKDMSSVPSKDMVGGSAS
jgi:hypothetical protein